MFTPGVSQTRQLLGAVLDCKGVTKAKPPHRYQPEATDVDLKSHRTIYYPESVITVIGYVYIQDERYVCKTITRKQHLAAHRICN